MVRVCLPQPPHRQWANISRVADLCLPTRRGGPCSALEKSPQQVEVSLPLDDLRNLGQDDVDDMVVYRRDTPTMAKLSALDLMSKEFATAALSGGAAGDGAVPRVADDRNTSRGELRPAMDRFNTLARLTSQQEDELLLEAPHRDSFRSAMRLPVLIGQCFSLLPTSSKPDIVPRFRVASLRVLYSALVTLGLFCNAILSIVYVVRHRSEENTLTASSSWVFYVSATTVSVLYLRLAVQWRGMCVVFRRVEHVMKSVGHPPRLRQRLHGVTITVLSLALLEYSLAVMKGIFLMDLKKYKSLSEFLYDYFAGSYSHLLLLFPYSPMLLVVIQALNTAATFMWNYNDLFIMLTSIAIAQRFKLLNQKLHDSPREEKTVTFWKRAREMYNSLAVLTREVDKILCVQILFSFMNNLYFICMQLLRTVKQDNNTSTLQSLYFAYSFGFLVLRTAAVSLFAASINDESKNVKKILYSVSSGSYCEEVDRFIMQATTDDIALTGLKFFSVTRSFLLTVAGTIATYEIVLVQFNGNKKVS
ncbi:gustatory receptor for sugar taste 64e-like [Thrips palmi]|uniref:Gustatory receptor for sugar taste 64e-like n=1 Tax=Thrips palmi TaxID=161013 RepID=A0A6P8Y6N6_THRPL|nr:gustatory receptor for sugar taste 64e-like [Thrips palmi]